MVIKNEITDAENMVVIRSKSEEIQIAEGNQPIFSDINNSGDMSTRVNLGSSTVLYI